MDTNELGNSIKLRKNGGFTHFRYTSSKIGFCWLISKGWYIRNMSLLFQITSATWDD